MAVIRIPDATAFNLRITGQHVVGEYTEDASFAVLTNLIVNFIRLGREAQVYTLDADGRIVADNDGTLARGKYGVELFGYYNGQPWRYYEKNVFQIVNSSSEYDSGTEGEETLTYDITFQVSFGGTGITSAFVDAAIAAHNSDETAHDDIREELGDKIVDVQVDGQTIVDPTTKVANINPEDFGEVDDVRVNEQTVVTNKVANITVPVKVSDLPNDAGYATTTEVTQAISDAAINNVGVTVDANIGTPSATASISGSTLTLDFANLKGATGATGNGIASVQQTTTSTESEGVNVTTITTTDGASSAINIRNGKQGKQGASAVFDPDTGNVLATLHNTIGADDANTMTQKAISDELVAINENVGRQTSIDLSTFTLYNCSLGSTKWYLNSTGKLQRHIAIPVNLGETYILRNTTSISNPQGFAFLREHNPPYSNNTSIPFVAGLSERVILAAGDTVVLSVPYNATHLCLTMVDGANADCEWTLTRMAKPDNAVAITSAVDGLFTKSVVSDTGVSAGGHISLVKQTYTFSSTYYGCQIAFSQYAGKLISVKSNGGNTCRFAFLSAAMPATTGSSVTFCDGEGLRDGEYFGFVPSDCIYIYVYTYANGTNVRPTITIYEPQNGGLYTTPQSVDISGLTAQNCSLGAAKWYMSSSGAQRHVAVPVTAGKTYKLCAERYAGLAAVVTSSYAPPYSNNAAIPFASCNSSRLTITSEEYITIPNDGAYIILTTVDGGGYSPIWKVYEVSAETLPIAELPKSIPTKIRIMSWNVGHWAMGTSYTSNLTPETFAAKETAYKQMVNEAAADIICCCEWSENVVNAGSGYNAMSAKDNLFPIYPHWRQGTLPSSTSYMRTVQISNIKQGATSQTTFTYTVGAGRYFQTCEYTINGRVIKVVATHLDFDQGTHGAEYRGYQIQQLINAFANDDYVIICADFNVASATEYETFTAAGYTAANHGYLGDLVTYSDNKCLDNILCKGFAMNEIAVYDDEFVLSDHRPIAATLTML